jgi:ribonuclease-3
MRKRGFRAESNEELEFLGDAVLELVISEELYRRCSKDGEGALTKLRQSLVCENMLAKIAAEINLGDYLNVGTGEESTDVRQRSKVLADALEAVIAAIYLDSKAQDNEQYREIILGIFDPYISDVIKNGYTDYKTLLQQFVEKNTGSVLRYEYLESGPEHKKHFVATAYVNNNAVGTGEGNTKRSAETSAARSALELFGISR